MKLNGKTILITGAAKRIGRSLALSVAGNGGNLLIHHRQSAAEITSLKNEIEKLGKQATILQADFSDPDATQQFAEDLFSRNEIYAVINNASLFEDRGWSDTSLASWNSHLAVNLTAPFIISQAFGRHLSSQSSGRIINLLDWRALRPGADHFPYTISKAGLAGLTRSLAQALAPRITVNGIALGAILPPSDGGNAEKIVADLPNPRWAQIAEVEDTLMFLLTGPDYITGEIIHLDGGRHLV